MPKKVALLCLSTYLHIGCINESINNIKKYSKHEVDIIYINKSIDDRIQKYFKNVYDKKRKELSEQYHENFMMYNKESRLHETIYNMKSGKYIIKSLINNLVKINTGEIEKKNPNYNIIFQTLNKIKKRQLPITKNKEVDNIIINLFNIYRLTYVELFQKYQGIIFHYDLIDSSYLFLNYDIFKNYTGVKICMMQDEYIHNINFVKDNNFDFFYHVSNTNLICKYNKNLLEGIKLRQILTGYVPNINVQKIHMKNKTTNIFYRGRLKMLTYFYGGLVNDKINIGIKMREYAINNKITNVDIELEDKYRIYGQEWYDKLRNSKTTLATQSGCDVFHVSKQDVDRYQRNNPSFTYAQIKDHFNLEKEYKNNYGVVSPKMFEAIKCNCVLIMFPGNYNNILKANIHYIELQKDFSNIEDVMKKVHDDEFLQNIADRAYTDIVESGKYSFQYFIKNVLDPELSI